MHISVVKGFFHAGDGAFLNEDEEPILLRVVAGQLAFEGWVFEAHPRDPGGQAASHQTAHYGAVLRGLCPEFFLHFAEG